MVGWGVVNLAGDLSLGIGKTWRAPKIVHTHTHTMRLLLISWFF